MTNDFQTRREDVLKISRDILVLSKNILLANYMFFDQAISKLKEVRWDIDAIATNGSLYIYNENYIIESYKFNYKKPIRDFLHVLLHCLFQHMFVSPKIDRRKWNLACDIAVESTVNQMELNLNFDDNHKIQKELIEQLNQDFDSLTAEKIYSHLISNEVTSEIITELEYHFFVDDHTYWYEELKSDVDYSFLNSKHSDEYPVQSLSNVHSSNASSSNLLNTKQEKLKNEWNEVAINMKEEITNFTSLRGDFHGNLINNLLSVTRTRYDYTAFLKKFSVYNEVIKTNEDEFDYIFYTYGLNLNKNVPLIEPLEYKESKVIRDFVIAIDTSGSTYHGLVYTFLKHTYSILAGTESFSTKVNIYIIQCDSTIQDVVKITSINDFEKYFKQIKVKGGGGTNFIPVFEYVDKLVKDEELNNLKGLIYFTDGYGVFPKNKPSYDVAFVFVDTENIPKTPSWSMKLILTKEEIGAFVNEH